MYGSTASVSLLILSARPEPSLDVKIWRLQTPDFHYKAGPVLKGLIWTNVEKASGQFFVFAVFVHELN